MKQCPICSQSFPDDQTACPSDGVRLIELHEWAPQTTVRGKYRILGKLGSGGMGVVYKAQHLILEEPRALKVMSPELARDAKFVRRFRQEAQVTRRLRHPNIVQVDDLDQADDGSLFIAMELVDGVSLRQLLERTRGPLPLARALGIAHGIAEALAAAHAQGLVHRDIKPDNVLLARDVTGRDIAKVLDFGIVAMKEGSAQLSSHPLLTPGYAPPEQWSGMKGSDLDGRADLYALGMTLYEMLTGKTAFHAETHAGWMNAHLNEEPQPPGRINAELPPEVDRLVLRLLAKDREHRTPTAEEFMEELKLVEAQSAWGQMTVAPRGPLPSRIVGATRDPEAALAPAPPAPAPGKGPEPPRGEVPAHGEHRPPEPSSRPSGRSRGGRAALIGAAIIVVTGLGIWFAMRSPNSSAPTISFFTAAPTSVERGASVRVAWAVKNADRVEVDPAFESRGAEGASLPLEGERSVVIRETTSYRLIATGLGGTVESTLTVEATAAAPDKTAPAGTVPARSSARPQPSTTAVALAQEIGVQAIRTAVATESAYRHLMGVRSWGVQDPTHDSDSPGSAAIEDRGGTAFLQGTQRTDGGQMKIRAMVTRVDPSSFEAEGFIEAQNPSVNGGRPCVLRGKMTFRMAEDGGWRLYLPNSPCTEEGDFLALSVDPPTPPRRPSEPTQDSPPAAEPRAEPGRSTEPASPGPSPSETPREPVQSSGPPPHNAPAPPEPGETVRFKGTYGGNSCELALVAISSDGHFRGGTLKIYSGGGVAQSIQLKVSPSNDPTFVTLLDQRGCRLTARATLDSWGWPERLYEGEVRGTCPATQWEVSRVE